MNQQGGRQARSARRGRSRNMEGPAIEPFVHQRVPNQHDTPTASTSASASSGLTLPDKLSVPENVDCWAETEIKSDEFSFIWTVNNYSKLRENKIESPVFAYRQAMINWNVTLEPNKNAEVVISLILTDMHNKIEGDINAYRVMQGLFEISALNTKWQPILKAVIQPESASGLNQYSCNWKSTDVTTKMGSMIPIPESLVVSDDDRFILQFTFWIHESIHHQVGTGIAGKLGLSEDDVKLSQKERLSTDLGNFCFNSTFSDVVLTTKYNKYYAHKAFLAARSRVFANLFKIDKKSKEIIVDFSDYHDDIVKGLLRYIYAGSTEALSEWAEDLLVLAHFYDMKELKEECADKLAQDVTDDNVAQTLNLAVSYKALDLKLKTNDYVSRYIERLLKNESFLPVFKAKPYLFEDLHLHEGVKRRGQR